MTRLRVLLEVTRRGSVTAAAHVLWITPSAVSQAIAALEREAGVKLLRRVGRGAPAIDGLRADKPDLVVEVEDLEGALALDAVRLGRIDLAIVDDWSWDGAAQHGDLTLTELFEDPLVVVMPASHALAEAAVVGWRQLAGLPFVVEDASSPFAQAVAAHCRRSGFEPRILARVHDLAAQCALVAAAGYVCVLPRLATTATDLPVRPLAPALRRRLLAVTRGDEGELPGILALLEALLRTSPDGAAAEPPAPGDA